MGSSIIYFTKAGTFDWAFKGDEYVSQTSAFSWYLPHALYNLGKVHSYFITLPAQSRQLEVVRMFPNPKQY